MILFFIYIIIIINIFEFINNQSLCLYNDCFNCTVCGSEQICNCEWSTISKSCKNENSIKKLFDYNYNYFDSCYDENSVKIQRYYCGNYYIKLNDQNTADINLLDKNGKYGAQNLYCDYIYDQIITSSSNINYNILVKISPSIIDYIKIGLTITYNDNKIEQKEINEAEFEENYKNARKIKINIYFKQQLSFDPFSIKITKKELKNNYKIYIAMGIILLSCIICGIIIYCISKKATQKARRRQEMYLQILANQRRRIEEQYNRVSPTSSRDPSSSSESEISISEINTKKIEKLLNTILAPINYYKHLGEKEGNPCTVCTICIEEFKIGKSKVSVTPCHHIFHFKCLSNWLNKNVLNPKCPNCNHNLLQELNNECSQGLYDIPEIPCINKRSIDRRPTNINVRQNYNDHNNSINMAEHGLDTGENRFITISLNRRYDNNCVRNLDVVNINVNKSENKLKNNNKIETTGNREEDIDEVVIENYDNNEI